MYATGTVSRSETPLYSFCCIQNYYIKGTLWVSCQNLESLMYKITHVAEPLNDYFESRLEISF